MSAEEEDTENIVLTPEKANDDDEPVDNNETGLSQKKVSIAASLNDKEETSTSKVSPGA